MEPEKTQARFLHLSLAGRFERDICCGHLENDFKLHPLSPSLSFNKYYLQLVPAHLVFAVFAGIGYNILSKNKNYAASYQ
jgi:hypothetical protein